MFPTNSTGLSLAGILKWIAIIACGVNVWIGLSAIISKKTSPDRSTLLVGNDAVRQGFVNLGWALGLGLLAFAIWFFWQRNED